MSTNAHERVVTWDEGGTCASQGQAPRSPLCIESRQTNASLLPLGGHGARPLRGSLSPVLFSCFGWTYSQLTYGVQRAV